MPFANSSALSLWGQATAILHYLGIDNICMWMSVDNEEISLAVCNLLQTITDCLLGQGKEEHHGKEEAVVLGNGSPWSCWRSKGAAPLTSIPMLQPCDGFEWYSLSSAFRENF